MTADEQKPSALISPEEAAAVLGVSAATVRAHVRAGTWVGIGAGAAQLPDSTRWSYVIPRAAFVRMVAGTLPVATVTVTVHPQASPDETVRAALTKALAALDAA